MKLGIAIVATVATQDIFDYMEGSGMAAEDQKFLEENCVMLCGDGACITEEQRCDGKVDCIDRVDEHDCQIADDEANADHIKSGGRRQPPGRAPPGRGPPAQMPVSAVGGAMNSIYKMRGRMPGGAGMPESTFKAFDSQSFGRFQRKNKKVTEFLLEGKSNPRYELMMKMLYYMSSGSQSISDYFSYGCHCNLSGSGHGKAQDEIDSACSRNNGCRKCAQMDFNCSWNSAYFVNGWQQGSENGIVCVDQPGSCQRALCECDLQLVKDLVSESNTWSKKNHQFYGFDLDDGCKADSAGMAGRSLNGKSSSGNDQSKNESCCGIYPNRFPYATGQGRECCNDKTYNTHHMECCRGNELVPIGSC